MKGLLEPDFDAMLDEIRSNDRLPNLDKEVEYALNNPHLLLCLTDDLPHVILPSKSSNKGEENGNERKNIQAGIA